MRERSSSAAARGRAVAASEKATARILIVDDEPDMCALLRHLLERDGYTVTAETSARAALERISKQDFDLVLTDLCMVEMTGLELCRLVLEARPELPVILLTARGDMDTVLSALRIGARDFLTKPIDATSLSVSVARALRQGTPRDGVPTPAGSVARAEPERTPPCVLGRSAAIQRVHELVENLSSSVASVLLQGETGTGKEIVARAIHESSRFRGGPFVAVNCAAVPPGLLESELFGHVRGAFTDARGESKGLFLQANGGTLLLDEVGELPPVMQPKLLRALQERRVRPVGGAEELPFDCRVIAATNRDLEKEVSEKRFREDLYYRLDVVRIIVPPLRARGDDILLLARHFLERFAGKLHRDATLSAAVEEKLLVYAWPGNVRELENCIERAVALSGSEELGVEHLPEKIRLADGSCDCPAEPDADPRIASLFELERRHILRALEMFDGNKTLAADVLGIDRRTLHRKLRQYAEPPAS